MTAPSKAKIVRGNQRSELMVVMKARNQCKNCFGGVAIEIPGGFVGQQDLRLGDQCPSQSHALLFATGKFSGTVMSTLFQSDLA